MVDDRRATILRAVVEQYIETSQPVSSSHVTNAGAVTASSATVRSEMAALERDGYLQQPHTSAGRIPTDRGYRFFVDQLNTPGTLQPSQQQNVRTFFDKASGEIEQMLHETGRLLSDLTGAAGVVVGPDAGKKESASIRSVQLVTLSERVGLAVVVLSNGSVEKRTVDLPAGTNDAVASATSAHLQAQLINETLTAPITMQSSGNADVDALSAHVLAVLQAEHTEEHSDQFYVQGASRLAVAFDAVEAVRNVLTILEQQFVVVSLIRDLLDRGLSVSIGAENKLVPLEHFSLVVAPTIVDGEQRGSVAVLGPTRMDYAQAMAAVTVVSRRLGERLGETKQ
jgi:heat-inducible transcriptional repressor